MDCETVAFFLFNRPDTTKRVFDRIAEAKPKRLLVIADGPRFDRPGEEILCHQARAVVEGVDWPCEVLRNYSDVNMGCRDRVVSGLSWVFEEEERAIILEDDCLPDPTFFSYSTELLERYRHDERVMAITGTSFHPSHAREDAHYCFSRFFHCWGWAAWRRSWKHYDASMRQWPTPCGLEWLRDVLDGDEGGAAFWEQQFTDTRLGRINTWDYQFVFTLWHTGGLVAHPCHNLVSNIGFRPDATHTRDTQSRLADYPTRPLSFPLKHPHTVVRDVARDEWLQAHVFGRLDARRRPKRLIHKVLRRMRDFVRKAG